MKRARGGDRGDHRFAQKSNVRHAVAVEAARLLYYREFKEYFQAKREAARRQQTKVLPTNSEIHQQLLILADKIEGPSRLLRLHEMRQVALDFMTLLEEFEPRLIGSTWTGHIRHGSDVDIQLHGQSLEAVEDVLHKARIRFEVEVVQSRKQGEERQFVHLHVVHESGLLVEMTLYEPEHLKEYLICSISGGPMPRATLAQLRQKLAEQGEDALKTERTKERSVWAERLEVLDLPALLDSMPELAACRGVAQNHYHHTDVYEHSLDVATLLFHFQSSSFQEFEGLQGALKDHFDRAQVGGWTPISLLILAGLCHDLGKAQTGKVHRSGRLQFPGHERRSAELSHQISERWELPQVIEESLVRLVEHHAEPIRYANAIAPVPSRLHRLFASLGDLMPELLLLSLADVRAARGEAQTEHRLDQQRLFVAEMLEEFFDQGFLRFPTVPVSVTDLDTELGITDPRLRERLFRRLTDAYIDGEFQGREDGLVMASELMTLVAWEDEAD